MGFAKEQKVRFACAAHFRKKMPSKKLAAVQRDFIEGSARTFQRLGMPRSAGQIYGLIYLSEVPLTLDDIVSKIKVSKGSASNATRQLLEIGAIRQTWILGDRRPHFDAVENLGEVLRRICEQFVLQPVMAAARSIEGLIENFEEKKEDGISRTEAELYRRRLENMLEAGRRLGKGVSHLEAHLKEA